MYNLLLNGSEVVDTLYNVEDGLNSLNNSAFSLYGIFLALSGMLGIGISALIAIISIIKIIQMKICLN